MTPHLGYCTNIHPGETWREVRAVLEDVVPAVKRRVSPSAPLGVGLRLSNDAARAVDVGELREVLGRNGLYVFTLNGFPYGPFGDAAPVKADVYRPSWCDVARVDYTARLAWILAEIVPTGVEGTISTVPLGFAPTWRPELDAQAARALCATLRTLHRIEQERAVVITLALEPEPFCRLETAADAIRFFERSLFARARLDELSSTLGVGRAEAEAYARRAIGVCLDACHMAVENEAPGPTLEALDAAGIRVAKVQLGAGLRATVGGPDDMRGVLRQLADPIFLHQVVERGEGTCRRFLDLPDALAAAERDPDVRREWFIHHHVPVHRARLGPVPTTQQYLVELLEALRGRTVPAMELETYTWSVLPREHRGASVVDDLAEELAFVRGLVTGG